MRAKEFITERNHGGPLYHLTKFKYIKSILTEGLEFSYVEPSGLGVESVFAPGNNEYRYFLSASRTLTSAFRITHKKELTMGYNISFLLNTAYFNQKDFIIKPVNYFDKTNMPKYYESEERIWSKKGVHPAGKCISEIHGVMPFAVSLINPILEAGIPYYLYYDENDFILHRKTKAISPEQLKEIIGNYRK